MVRIAAYAGLRQGELLALRWRDVDFAGSALTIARAMSAGVESSTKSGRVRRVSLADQAASALDRMSRRDYYTSPDELVFCNVFGRRSTARGYVDATSARRSQPTFARCASMTYGTRSGRCWRRAASTS